MLCKIHADQISLFSKAETESTKREERSPGPDPRTRTQGTPGQTDYRRYRDRQKTKGTTNFFVGPLAFSVETTPRCTRITPTSRCNPGRPR